VAKVTAFDAKTRFGELLDRVIKGEEVVITRHDKPVARLVPEGAQRLDEVRRAVPDSVIAKRIRRRSKPKLSDREVGLRSTGSVVTRAFIADASVAMGCIRSRRPTRPRVGRRWRGRDT
jgi:prevent-host-death family protein